MLQGRGRHGWCKVFAVLSRSSGLTGTSGSSSGLPGTLGCTCCWSLAGNRDGQGTAELQRWHTGWCDLRRCWQALGAGGGGSTLHTQHAGGVHHILLLFSCREQLAQPIGTGPQGAHSGMPSPCCSSLEQGTARSHCCLTSRLGPRCVPQDWPCPPGSTGVAYAGHRGVALWRLNPLCCILQSSRSLRGGIM